MKNNQTSSSIIQKNIFKFLFVLIVIGIGFTACITINNLFGTGAFANPLVKELVFPKADYYSIVHIGQNLVAFASTDDAIVLSYAQEGDQTLQKISFPADPNCGLSTAYDIFDTFPNGRIQLWKLCFTRPTRQDYLLAYDWQTHKTEQIAGPLPLGSDGISWNPDRTHAIVYLNDGFASRTLYWLSNDSFGPADLVIKDDGLSWNLKDDFPDFQGAEAGTTGNVGRAAWSPDGQTIAFFASTEAIGKTGVSREGYFKLYLMDQKELKPRPVLKGVRSPFVLSWSPDSAYIAFVGFYGNIFNGGIWIYSLATNSVIGVAKGNFQRILWTEDGKSLIAIRCEEVHDCSQIQEYDIKKILTP